jgi:D-arabinose 1-dehydrogenase-like Zn-dependent alcohol dehydrogenase
VSKELQALGGVKIVLATATDSKAMSDTINGLGIDGKLIIIGVSQEPIPLNSLALITKRAGVAGWPSGTSMDSQDTMKFSARTGVRSMNEAFPLEKVDEAYKHMMEGKARFRVVLTMDAKK